MVNLAKLRKKAKEKKSTAEETAAANAAPPEAPESSAAPLPAPAPDPGRPAAASPAPDKIARYLETAGEKRSEAKADQAPVTGPQLELLTFLISGEQYAIDIEHVVEIVTPRPATRVPNADPSIVGILSLRGTIVMLVDARRRLGHRATRAADADTRIIVVQQDSDTIGFIVDRVLRVVKIDPAAVEPQPVVHSSEHDESVRGVFRHGDALTILLDLSKLLFTVQNEWN